MSDLSEFVEEMTITDRGFVGSCCQDCIPVVEFSVWPADTLNMPPSPRGPWVESEPFKVFNVSHAPTCPTFWRYWHQIGTPDGIYFTTFADTAENRSKLGPMNNVLWREQILIEEER